MQCSVVECDVLECSEGVVVVVSSVVYWSVVWCSGWLYVEIATKPSRFAHFEAVHNPLRLPCETTSEPPKVVRTWCV